MRVKNEMSEVERGCMSSRGEVKRKRGGVRGWWGKKKKKRRVSGGKYTMRTEGEGK